MLENVRAAVFIEQGDEVANGKYCHSLWPLFLIFLATCFLFCFLAGKTVRGNGGKRLFECGYHLGNLPEMPLGRALSEAATVGWWVVGGSPLTSVYRVDDDRPCAAFNHNFGYVGST